MRSIYQPIGEMNSIENTVMQTGEDRAHVRFVCDVMYFGDVGLIAKCPWTFYGCTVLL